MSSEEKTIEQKQKAVAELADKVDRIRTLIHEAESLATEFKLSFALNISYGMGGRFEDGEWNSSSSNC